MLSKVWNHRISQVGSDLQGLPNPTLGSTHDHLNFKPWTMGIVQTLPEFQQPGAMATALVSLFQSLTTLLVKNKKKVRYSQITGSEQGLCKHVALSKP